MVQAGEVLRKPFKAMGGVSVPGKKDEGSTLPSPIQDLKPDPRFYRDKLHLRSLGKWIRWSGERLVIELTSGCSAQDENTTDKTKASICVHLGSLSSHVLVS